MEARRCTAFIHGVMGRGVDPYGEPIELFLVATSAQQLW